MKTAIKTISAVVLAAGVAFSGSGAAQAASAPVPYKVHNYDRTETSLYKANGFHHGVTYWATNSVNNKAQLNKCKSRAWSDKNKIRSYGVKRYSVSSCYIMRNKYNKQLYFWNTWSYTK